jgi:excisionase family DNA binding protein
MTELMTTDEAATYLRLSERKLYELVANGAVPCTKVTGKWLFPKAALDRWLASGLVTPAGLTLSPRPPLIGGSQDPLLDWALRDSGCGLASLPEGSEAGLPSCRKIPRGTSNVISIMSCNTVNFLNFDLIKMISGKSNNIYIRIYEISKVDSAQ